MSPNPKGRKGKLRQQFNEATLALAGAQRTLREQNKAILAASGAMDQQTQEITILRQILIGERAMVIFYADKCAAYAQRKCLDVTVPDFLKLPDEAKEPYIKRAILELSPDSQKPS